MDDDEGQEDEGPLFAWLPPEDRLWRHPSEMAGGGTAAAPGRPTGAAGHLWTVAMAAGVVGALVASAVLIAMGTMHNQPVKEIEKVKVASPVATTSANSLDPSFSWAGVVKMLTPSIVAVSSSLGAAQGDSGSGVLFMTDGDNAVYVVTSEDLLDGGTLTVTFDDGKPEKAKVVGKDNITGLAVLAVKTSDRDIANWGDVASLTSATDVLTIGARQADETSYEPGVVNSTDYSVTNQNDSTMVNMLSVSNAASLPSNLDGGAVVTQSGNVVGVYTAAASGGTSQSGNAYALPGDLVRHVGDAIVAGQKVTHPWIGIGSATDVTATSGSDLGAATGVKVGSVCPGSPAARTHLAKGDIVTSIGRARITTAGELLSYLIDNTRIGQKVKVGFHAPEEPTRYAEVRVADEPSSISC